MNKLISIGQILDHTIDHYVKHFKTIMKFSAWFFVVSILLIIAGLLMPVTDTTTLYDFSLTNTEAAGSILMILSVLIVTPIVSIWIFLSLINVTNDLFLGKKIDTKAIGKLSWKTFIPYVWVGALRFLVLLIPAVVVLPGLGLIVANLYYDGGIWLGTLSILLTFIGSLVGIVLLVALSVFLSFVGYMLVLENKRGMSALRASKELVKGRFWAVFLRLLAPRLVFVFAFILLQFFAGVLTTPLTAFAASNIAALTHMADVLNNLISGGITVLSVPLYIIADYILYDSLRKTKQTTTAERN